MTMGIMSVTNKSPHLRTLLYHAFGCNTGWQVQERHFSFHKFERFSSHRIEIVQVNCQTDLDFQQ